MTKEVLATDIDEVLFPFLQEFSNWHNAEYGTDLGVENFNSYEFNDTLGVSVPETVHRVHTFLGVEHGFLGVPPLKESQNAIEKLSERFEIVAITARHPQFRESSLKYLTEYYGGKITEISLVGTSATVEFVRSKAEVCRELGAVALIDDSIKHVASCVDTEVEGLLFGNYPWNQSEDLPNGVIRFNNWSEILRYFNVN